MTFQQACLNDATVHCALQNGCSLEEIVAGLVEQKQEMLKRIIELQSIAPKRITSAGITYVWHCPDNLIPEEKI
jgi:hypothetical protein